MQIFSGATGEELQRVQAGLTTFHEIGRGIAYLGDLNADGRGDYALGAPRGGFWGEGVVYAFLSYRVQRYCDPALPNSTGQSARIEISGSTRVERNNLTLTARDLPPGQFGYFLTSRMMGASQPMGSSGILCLSGNIGRFNGVGQIFVGPDGSLQLDLTAFPVNPTASVQIGETWNFQAWFRDTPMTSQFTDAVSVTFD